MDGAWNRGLATRREFISRAGSAAAFAGALPQAFAGMPAVKPLRPVPNARQVEWADCEVGMFFHWDIRVMNWTADGKPRKAPPGTRCTPAEWYNPERLDTDQWMEAAKALGAKYALFTAKHGSGFLQWQSSAYDYSMKQSPYRGGQGDVVKMFVESCRRYGIKPCLYLSFDNNRYLMAGRFKVVNADESMRLRYKRICERYASEIWGDYGELFEIWIDGGLPPPETGIELVPLIEKYQPNAIVFGGEGKNLSSLRWARNEDGFVRYPAPATNGDQWQPFECATPLQRHFRWFWSPGCEKHNRSWEELVSMYYHLPGRNANFLLGATPGPDGLIPKADMDLYAHVGKMIKERFSNPLGKASGEGDVVTITFPAVTEINQMSVREDIAKGGERIAAYVVEGQLADGFWKPLCTGTVVGHRRVDLFEKTPVKAVRFRALTAYDKPLIRDFEVFRMDSWKPVIV